MATLWCVTLVLLLVGGHAIAQITTNPPAVNFGSAVVSSPENASNVTVFCEVTFGDGGSMFTTAWFLTLKSGSRERILFDEFEPNFETFGLQSNFTILSFSAELDMATLECTNSLIPPNNQTVYFTLRTLG